MALNKQITRNEIFSQKKLTKFSCTFQPFHCAKLKIHRDNPEARGCDIFVHKMANFLWANIFWSKALILLSSTYWHFSLSKILKKFLEQIQSYEDAPHFWTHNGLFTPNKNFFERKILILFSSTYWPLSKMVHLPKWEFFPQNLFYFTKLALFLQFMPIYMLKIKVRY